MIYILWHEFCYWGGMVVAICEALVDLALIPLGGIYYLCRRRYPDCFLFWLSRKIDHYNVAAFGK